MAWYMVWPGGQGIVYGMVWWVRHDIWYGLVAMACYMQWPGGHYMVYGLACGHCIVYGMA